MGTEPTSGGTPDPSGSGGNPDDIDPGNPNPNPDPDPTPDPAPEPDPKGDTVSRKAYDKALTEKRNAMKRLKELEDAETARREKELEDEGNFREIIANREKRIEELEGQVSTLNDTFTRGAKLDAFLNLVKTDYAADIKETYWGLVNLEKIAVNPDNGQPDPATVKTVVDEFVNKYPETLRKKNGGNPPPGNPPGGTGGKLAYSDWLKLPYKEKMARQKDIDPESRPSRQ